MKLLQPEDEAGDQELAAPGTFVPCIITGINHMFQSTQIGLREVHQAASHGWRIEFSNFDIDVHASITIALQKEPASVFTF